MEHLNSIQNIRAAATSAANSFVSNRQNSVLLNVESEPSRISSSNLLITSQREPVSPSQSTATKASSVHSNGKSKNNVKIETCMDKWYKEMKGQILVNKS